MSRDAASTQVIRTQTFKAAAANDEFDEQVKKAANEDETIRKLVGGQERLQGEENDT